MLGAREEQDQEEHESRGEREGEVGGPGGIRRNRRNLGGGAGHGKRRDGGTSCGEDLGRHEDEPESERGLAGCWRFAGVRVVDVGRGNGGVVKRGKHEFNLVSLTGLVRDGLALRYVHAISAV